MLRMSAFLAGLFLFACSSHNAKVKLEKELSSFCRDTAEIGRYANIAFDFIVFIESYAKLADSIRAQLPSRLVERIEKQASAREGFYLMLCNGDRVGYALPLQGFPCALLVSPIIKKNQTLLFMRSGAVGPLDLWEGFYSRGKACYDSAKYDSAALYCSRAIGFDSGRAPAYFCRGNAGRRLKQYESAVADFTLGLALDTANVDAYYGRGEAYFNLERYPEAIQDLSRAVSKDYLFLDAYYLRGAARKKMNDSKEACEDYQRAESLDPKRVLTYENYCD